MTNPPSQDRDTLGELKQLPVIPALRKEDNLPLAVQSPSQAVSPLFRKAA